MINSKFTESELSELEALDVRGGNTTDGARTQLRCINEAESCSGNVDQLECTNKVANCGFVSTD